MPPWVPIAIVATLVVVLLVLVGVWLIRRDQRRFMSAADRLESTNQSLSDTAGRFARGVHELLAFLAQMKWGKGPQP